jgi:aspartyl-tRNA(Asn)/glutamyl-tRNA(Gln) amidotransferase subunit A
MTTTLWTVHQLAADLASGKTTSRELVDTALARIADPAGEGARAFIKVYADAARAAADYSDTLRRAGVLRSPIEGLPISVKDLFDVGGDVTRAGSTLLADAPPAACDALAVARLRAAGAVIVGRANMVEFAFGGVGLNPHFGTPKNPWDRATGRVPGGSSSGSGVAQADGMGVMSLGSDTRGSVRIPAALCGVVGFKPTQSRVPREGVYPLSWSLDSVGPLVNSVACAAAFDEILCGVPMPPLAPLEAKGLRLLLPDASVMEGLDADVQAAFEAAVAQLSRAGAQIVKQPVPLFDRQAEYFNAGGLAGPEAYVIHMDQADQLPQMDPHVAARICLGRSVSAADYILLARLRAEVVAQFTDFVAPFDAVIMPTVPCVAPTIAEVNASSDDYVRWNLRLLRNPGVINFLDGCAITIPCHTPGSAPVGLMLCSSNGRDRHLLAVAAAAEAALAVCPVTAAA